MFTWSEWETTAGFGALRGILSERHFRCGIVVASLRIDSNGVQQHQEYQFKGY